MKDTIETIRRSSFRFFSGTFLSRITGMFRDVSMAYAFGTKPSVAAFMVAFRFAHLLRRLFGEGALQSAFIPEFETLRHQNEERAFTFFRDLTTTLSFFLVMVIGIGCIILSGFLLWGNLHPNNQEIVYLTLLMLPSLLFICLFGLNTSFLQCEKVYFIPSFAPVAFNLIWITAIFSLEHLSAEEAMPWLSIGVVIACLFQWLLTIPHTLKGVKRVLSSFRPSFSLRSHDLRRLWKPLSLGILGVAASQINNAIDSLFAHFAEPEGPAFLWYAIRIQQLPLALFGIAIAGAVLPPLSRAIKAQQREHYNHFLNDALSRTWTFMLPINAALFIIGDISISFLYGHGDFQMDAIRKTTFCLWAYGIGLIPSALVLILAPASYAQNNYILPAIASFATMLLNLIFNTVCITILNWGAVSVALATSVSAWINLFFLGWKLSKNETPLFSKLLLQQIAPITLGTALAFWSTYLFRFVFEQIPCFSEAFFTASIYFQLSIIAYLSIVFFSLLITFTYLINRCVTIYIKNHIQTLNKIN